MRVRTNGSGDSNRNLAVTQSPRAVKIDSSCELDIYVWSPRAKERLGYRIDRIIYNSPSLP